MASTAAALKKENAQLYKTVDELTKALNEEKKKSAELRNELDAMRGMQAQVNATSTCFSVLCGVIENSGLLGEDTTTILKEIAAAVAMEGEVVRDSKYLDTLKAKALESAGPSSRIPRTVADSTKKRFVIHGPAAVTAEEVHQECAAVLRTSASSISVDKVSMPVGDDDEPPRKRATFVVLADAHHVDKALNTGIVRAQLKEKGSKLYLDWYCTKEMLQERAKLQPLRAELVQKNVWVKWDGVKLMKQVTKDDGSKVWEEATANTTAASASPSSA